MPRVSARQPCPTTVRRRLGILVGLLVFGASQTLWSASVAVHPIASGEIQNYLISAGILLLGFGAATWTDAAAVSPSYDRVAGAVGDALPRSRWVPQPF